MTCQSSQTGSFKDLRHIKAVPNGLNVTCLKAMVSHRNKEQLLQSRTRMPSGCRTTMPRCQPLTNKGTVPQEHVDNHNQGFQPLTIRWRQCHTNLEEGFKHSSERVNRTGDQQRSLILAPFDSPHLQVHYNNFHLDG